MRDGERQPGDRAEDDTPPDPSSQADLAHPPVASATPLNEAETPHDPSPPASEGDFDTDPASPGARKPREAEGVAGESVEALLGGLRRTAPQVTQSDGKDKAVYHGEHRVVAAQDGPVEEEAKVVVERSPFGTTARIERDRLPARPRRAGTTTAAGVPNVGARVGVAIVAAIAVVATVFVLLRARTGDAVPPPGAAAPAPSATSPPAAAPPAAASASTTAAPVTDVSPAASASPSVSVTVQADPSPAERASSGRAPKARSAQVAASSSSGEDLGEFKPTFH